MAILKNKDADYIAEIYNLVEEMWREMPTSVEDNLLSKLAARFGDAYFFVGPSGDLCLLTDVRLLSK